MNNFRGNTQSGPTPVSVGEELDVRIEAVGEKGDGIARYKGFVLFVPGTKMGEYLHIRVTKVLQKVGFAESLGPSQKKDGGNSHRVSVEPEPEEKYEDSENFGEEEQ